MRGKIEQIVADGNVVDRANKCVHTIVCHMWDVYARAAAVCVPSDNMRAHVVSKVTIGRCRITVCANLVSPRHIFAHCINVMCVNTYTYAYMCVLAGAGTTFSEHCPHTDYLKNDSR
jgi:hypothetical protein